MSPKDQAPVPVRHRRPAPSNAAAWAAAVLAISAGHGAFADAANGAFAYVGSGIL